MGKWSLPQGILLKISSFTNWCGHWCWRCCRFAPDLKSAKEYLDQTGNLKCLLCFFLKQCCKKIISETLEIQQRTPAMKGKELGQRSFVSLGGLDTHPGISTSAWRRNWWLPGSLLPRHQCCWKRRRRWELTHLLSEGLSVKPAVGWVWIGKKISEMKSVTKFRLGFPGSTKGLSARCSGFSCTWSCERRVTVFTLGDPWIHSWQKVGCLYVLLHVGVSCSSAMKVSSSKLFLYSRSFSQYVQRLKF